MKSNFFATTPGVILVGAVIGVIAVALQKLGNPGNMGICIACFERDVAGGLGLHRAAVVQYLRPEIMGLVLGSPISVLILLLYVPIIAKRIRNEEAVLAEGLKGYRAYMRKVRWRVIPGVW